MSSSAPSTLKALMAEEETRSDSPEAQNPKGSDP